MENYNKGLATVLEKGGGQKNLKTNNFSSNKFSDKNHNEVSKPIGSNQITNVDKNINPVSNKLEDRIEENLQIKSFEDLGNIMNTVKPNDILDIRKNHYIR